AFLSAGGTPVPRLWSAHHGGACCCISLRKAIRNLLATVRLPLCPHRRVLLPRRCRFFRTRLPASVGPSPSKEKSPARTISSSMARLKGKFTLPRAVSRLAPTPASLPKSTPVNSPLAAKPLARADHDSAARVGPTATFDTA